MSALFMAMILTGAGGMAEAQGGGKPVPVPGPYVMPPAPLPAPPAPPMPRPRLLRDSFADYFTAADYPAGALPLGGHAYVSFSLAFGTDGRVTECVVRISSGSPALDQATCRVIRERARYRPLLDADGRPMAGRHGGGVMWEAPARPGDSARIMIPAPPPPPGITPPRRARANLNTYFSVDDYPAAALRANDQGVTGVSLIIGPNGRVAACMVISSSGSAALDEATCRILTSRARYLPARDFDGNPANGRDSGRIIWTLPAE